MYEERKFKLMSRGFKSNRNLISFFKSCSFWDVLITIFIDDDECVECEAILEELETVDDEADSYGIDFVKNNDPHAARQYNIYNTPALVYFRRMSPVV